MVIKLGNIYGFTGGNFAGNVYSAKGIAPALIVGGGTTDDNRKEEKTDTY